VGKWMLLSCTVGYKRFTVMYVIKFEFNDIIAYNIILYTKNDFERRRISVDILYYI